MTREHRTSWQSRAVIGVLDALIVAGFTAIIVAASALIWEIAGARAVAAVWAVILLGAAWGIWRYD